MKQTRSRTTNGSGIERCQTFQVERKDNMPIIVIRALEIVVSYLPRISADLKRIADALENSKAKENNNG